MPSFTNRKDYTAEMLCEEADIISPLWKNSHDKELKKIQYDTLV
jgi:hypothetical protein